MKKNICWAALVLALYLPVCALAATEPNTRTIEDTTTYEGETIQITIDQWCYAFNRTSLRFFVANVYVDDPAQLQTAFAGEEYSKSNSEATSAIAERHDAILAVNGDYYNYKDKNGLVIRNGVLYRDEASTRDQLLIMNDGTFVALPRGTYNAGEGQKYIDEGVVQSFTFATTARRWNCRKNTSSRPRTPFASRARPSARWTQTTMSSSWRTAAATVGATRA